jgi:hypothetical protein
MGLSVYNSSKVLITDAGGAITTSHNGVRGESVDVLVYLRNDNPSVYYNNVVVSTEDSDSTDDTLGVYGTGRGFKLSSGARQPTEAEWDNVLAGDFVEMPDVGSSGGGDITTYFPLWIRVIVPGNTQVQTFQDVSLKIEASEHLVGN